MKLSKISVFVFVILGGLGIASSQERESIQGFIDHLPEGWQTARGILFVAGNLDGKDILIEYMVGDNGQLTPLQSLRFTPFHEIGRATDLTISSDEKYLFVANNSFSSDRLFTKKKGISAFLVRDNRSLQEVKHSPFAVRQINPVSLALSKDDRYLFVANSGSDAISVFLVKDDGSLQEVKDALFAVRRQPVSLVLSVDGRYLFVANSGSNSISMLAVEDDGSLNEITGSPFAVGNRPVSLVLSVDGRYLFVANSESNSVSVLAVQADGSLNEIAGSPFGVGVYPVSLALSSDGRYLFVANHQSNNISVLSVEDDGSLNAITDSPFSVGERPISLVLSDDNRYLFVITFMGLRAQVELFSVEDGALSFVRLPTELDKFNLHRLLFVPLPQKWKILQTITVGGAISELPGDIQKLIAQMIFKKIQLTPEQRRYEERSQRELFTWDSLTVEDMAEHIYHYYYDKDRVAGGWVYKLVSRVKTVPRGVVTPEGIKLLEKWAERKNSKELEEAIEIMQELLADPDVSADKAKAFKAIKDRLAQLYTVQRAQEQ